MQIPWQHHLGKKMYVSNVDAVKNTVQWMMLCGKDGRSEWNKVGPEWAHITTVTYTEDQSTLESPVDIELHVLD